MSSSKTEQTKQLSQYQKVIIITYGISSLIMLISENFLILVEIQKNNIYPENLYLFY
ncbi:unnamed protein product [Paramecium pentaurelia]|uniref:Uncharacterized protein n=1 Tax=Paramecium pentaurelia TaxID=43138 RepID=A0A8S1XQY2_9CILI|nr:unnamed protein product [Paramecium pentaurelia]